LNEWVRKKPNTCPQARARPQACTMQIKNHVKNDVKEKMVMQYVVNVILKLV